MRLTLFDLDGTLLPRDSDHAFGEFVVALGWADGDGFRQRYALRLQDDQQLHGDHRHDAGADRQHQHEQDVEPAAARDMLPGHWRQR